MTHYVFYEPGHIPGIPGGPYAGVRADVADDGTVTFSPLALSQAEPGGEALPIEEQGAETPSAPADETVSSKRKQKGDN